jgi:hypothetical protein
MKGCMVESTQGIMGDDGYDHLNCYRELVLYIDVVVLFDVHAFDYMRS